MPDQRVKTILDEISASAISPLVKELTAELGIVLADVVISELTHTQEANERLTTLGTYFNELRNEIRKLDQRVAEREENTSDKLHQLSNHIMGLEERLHELILLMQENSDQLDNDA